MSTVWIWPPYRRKGVHVEAVLYLKIYSNEPPQLILHPSPTQLSKWTSAGYQAFP